jgi:hypothetical protein
MTDLRTRIAALLYIRFAHALGYADEPWETVDQEPWLGDADAVIAELNLREEIRDPANFYYPGNRYSAGRTIHRYVTQWENR